jgi:CDP-glucose 4,6-dehydratase
MTGPFSDFYRGKTVLVTGHTGFKGSWLATWLLQLGARVVGYALAPPTEPSNFVASRLESRLAHVEGDVRNTQLIQRTFAEHQPDFVFHLAAQPIVRQSFVEPLLTFDVNLMGTVNVLQAAQQTRSVSGVVCITSDKCYQNVEWPWGYRETDALGGPDPYSASKACAELAIACYADRRFQQSVVGGRSLPIASVRAGNVIGGGDWAADRIVPDAIRALVAGRDLVVRNPDAVRPWQHVLEPLSGYLWLGALLAGDPRYVGAWNFGPSENDPPTVEQLVTGLLDRWDGDTTRLVIARDPGRHEATLLRLDCSKARQELGWHAVWDSPRTLDHVVGWYRNFYSGADVHDTCLRQIERYVDDAAGQSVAWCGGVARDGVAVTV